MSQVARWLRALADRIDPPQPQPIYAVGQWTWNGHEWVDRPWSSGNQCQVSWSITPR